MELSERAKLLISQSRIVSFTSWETKYSQEFISIFQAADDHGRYLTDEDLAQVTRLFPSLAPSVEQSKLLRDNAIDLVSKAREKVLAKFPGIADPNGELYPPERAEACWRDFWHFLRCITYGIAGQNLPFTSDNGLANMRSLYQELRVPLKPMIYGLTELKSLCLEQFNQSKENTPDIYFNHLIHCLEGFEGA